MACLDAADYPRGGLGADAANTSEYSTSGRSRSTARTLPGWRPCFLLPLGKFRLIVIGNVNKKSWQELLTKK